MVNPPSYRRIYAEEKSQHDEPDEHTPPRHPLDHALLREQTGNFGKKIYTAGSQRMWWQPLNTPDHVPAGAPRNGVAGRDVLVVEDESYLSDLIEEVLQAEGHRTRSAANGRDALDTLRDYTPNLILLDLMMPVMDGWEVIQYLRSNPRLSTIPVVIITAIYDMKRAQLDTGATAVLTKPFDIDQLAEVVRIYAT